uniref:Cytochrome c oxidase subunit 3 n=1 Tax=Panopea globosa TaxID=1237092 RepID=A0A0U1XJA8_9BIVA|nr:cytochrome c oxidase subunit III [Panopea globosa]AIU56070.1 cytochrome c oxidase subunit III [Panopea globosa]
MVNRTGYHLVDMSPWPLTASCGGLSLVSSLISWMHGGDHSVFMFLVSFSLLGLTMVAWWGDVVKEGTFLGCHTSLVVRGLRLGMALFILSEVFFFVSFFWAFFHFSLGSLAEGGCWPPLGVLPINAFGVPLLNTAVLLSSGVSVTWSHYAISSFEKKSALWGLVVTVVLGAYFSVLQFEEYVSASFCISDGVYGSIFFVMTGFHGLHVLIGTMFLIVGLVRTYFNHFVKGHNHFGLEAAIWYWHFVDVVWIFLFIFVYWWGS